MLTMAEELAEGLADIRAESSFEFVYHADGGDITLSNVVKATKKWRFNDDDGMSQHVETRDLIFAVSEFTGFKRGGNEPQAGKRISQAFTDYTDWYEVVSVNKERVWKFSDPEETTLRVHTLFLKREPN